MSLNSNNAYFDFVTREKHVPGFLTVPFQLAFPPDSNPTNSGASRSLVERTTHNDRALRQGREEYRRGSQQPRAPAVVIGDKQSDEAERRVSDEGQPA